MPAVTIQFHMLFYELTDFVAELMCQFSLDVELERFFPKKVRIVSADQDLAKKIATFGHVDRIWLLCKPPRCRKFERFNLYVGRVKSDHLEQSHLGAGTEKAEAFKVLQKIARQLKKRTTAGIWVRGETGQVGFAKNFRFSPGAAEVQRTGKMKLTAIGFGQSFHVDPPRGRSDGHYPEMAR